LEKVGFDRYTIVEDSKEALEAALAGESDYLVVTGSLYLVAELYSGIATGF
jgi:folylpolyglutamate synthase/dihydropteroate synthase